MRKHTPLPPDLGSPVFTRSRALDLGVSQERLRGTDLEAPSRQIRVVAGSAADPLDLAEAVQELTPEAVISYTTAARVWGMRLPRRLDEDRRVHVSTPSGTGQVRCKGVAGHRQRLPVGEVCRKDGLWVTAPARTWLDLASRLSVEDLVVAGDGLVVAHRHGVAAGRPVLCTVADLRRAVQAHTGARGVKRARAAADRVRVGSDSRPETLLRLALEDAGFRGLELDSALTGPDGFPQVQPDIALPEHRLSLQYEGGHHDTEGQRLRDVERQRRTEAHGWTELRVTWPDLTTLVPGPSGPEPRAVQLVRRAVHRRSP